MATTDLEYEPGSCVGPLLPEYVRAFEELLAAYREAETRLPAAYVEHLSNHHGGVPVTKCFPTASGKTRVLGRFLNFLKAEDLQPPLLPTWRYGVADNSRPDQDVRLDYSVWRLNPSELWEKLVPDLVPFAGLDTAGHDCRGMAEFDLLCFDYRAAGEPAVVTWSCDSWAEDETVTELVAPSFETFLPLLCRCPDTVAAAREAVQSF